MTAARPIEIDLTLCAASYLLEASLATLLMALHRLGERPVLTSIGSPPGLLGLSALAGVLISVGLILRCFLRSSQAKAVAFTALLNLVSVAIGLTTAEVAIRVFSRWDLDQPVFLGTRLGPRDWTSLSAHNRDELRRRTEKEGAYYDYDPVLGWTVGKSRQSPDGLYLSSVEGIRSQRPGMVHAEATPGHRIALVGDSYTFCEDVSYDDSWGNQLERRLGPGFQVLNFGVPGYGIDQAYLRYKLHARTWKPDVVIFGIFPHDLVRSMTVYSFVGFPESRSLYSKPRFVSEPPNLRLLNVPTITPQVMFSLGSITELPAIDYDWGFHPQDWRRRAYHASYLVRFLTSYVVPWRAARPASSDDDLAALNVEILRAFIRQAREEGSVPVIAYLPARVDLTPPAASPEHMILQHSIVHNAGLIDIDLTDVVRRVAESDRFVVGARHYSAQTNVRIAEHLESLIRAALAASNRRACG